ncbi:SDR family oxidoreductase [Marinivivus vitaminiproducens]|uniref:SDR family oxidoreductase n=1 Tax=Marinivivus vitaminiproducens TaxID=3035935 RepID=UPI00279C892A|nr:SDR family oxidoreductase [Geminicoccaceae bacterium SCSIO 64248]
MQLFDLSGDIALVTGAASGIGQAIAIGLAQAGADIACLDRPGSAGLADTLGRIEGQGRRGLALEADVRDVAALTEAVARVERDLGPLSVAVNAAGIANATPAEDMPEEQWRTMLDINLTGIFLSAQAEARAMLPRRRGSIVNIASMSGSIANRGLLQAHYNTSKAGVIHLTRSLAMEWAPHGLRVNAISPGYTLTPMNLRPEVAEQRKVFEETTPLARMATVEEMVGPAVFLSSKAASFVTGHDLIVDGGFVCW